MAPQSQSAGYTLRLRLSLLLAGLHRAKALPLFPQPGSSNVLCGPVGWGDLFMFFLLNYVAHAVTVKAHPGNKPIENVRWILAALLAPYSGVARGCAGIGKSRAITGESDIQHAARAGALCALRRSASWQPHPGELLTGCKITGSAPSGWASLVLNRTKTQDVCREEYDIHGQLPSSLPNGIILSRLPQDAVVEQMFPGELKLARSPAFFKSIAGMIQLVYAILTLTRTWGFQIEAFGYAAVGLTVIPYAILTLVNLVCHCVNPDYPTMFIVGNDVLNLRQREEFRINGQVGRIGEDLQFRDTVLVRDVRVPDEDDNDAPTLVFYERIPNTKSRIDTTKSLIQGLNREPNCQEYGDDHLSVSSSSTLAEVDCTTETSSRTSMDITDRNSTADENTAHCTVDASKAEEIIEICDFGPLPRRRIHVWPWRLCFCLLVLTIISPYLVIHALTGFKPGERARPDDRGWTLAQLVGGQVLGVALWWIMRQRAGGGAMQTLKLLPVILVAGLPCIGAFIFVARMFLSFGSCQLGPGSAVL